MEGGTAKTITSAPKIGDSIFEIKANGARAEWGRLWRGMSGVSFVTADRANKVEVNFFFNYNGTRVNLLAR